MSLSIGIVGLPNVGKSTLFNALTGNNILAANYPFATIEPNTGIVPIPDPRLDRLADLYTSGPPGLDGVQGDNEKRTNRTIGTVSESRNMATPQSAKSNSGVASLASQQAGAARRPRIVPATVTFVDIAGLVAGASQGEGLGNQFLSHIRSTNAICHVVRAFEDPNVVHVNNDSPDSIRADGVQGDNEKRTNRTIGTVNEFRKTATPQSATSASRVSGSARKQAGSANTVWDPEKDIDVINTELILADLQTVQNRLPKLEKETKANPKLSPVLKTLQRVQDLLNNGTPLSHINDIEQEYIQDLHLLTAKPVIYLFNVDENTMADDAKKSQLQSLVGSAKALFVCAKVESELSGLDEADRAELLESYGQKESGLVQVIHAAYDTLGLQSYLTAGDKEVRAWTIAKGSSAPQAAGVIHGDFERGFIAAEVVDYQDLVTAGSLAGARAAGKVRTEGKTYIMQPGDVVEFRFNI